MISGNIDLLWIVILGYALLYLLQTLVIARNKMTYNHLFTKYKLLLKKKILHIYTRIHIKEYEAYNVGDLRMRLEQDVAVTEQFFNLHILEYAYAVASTITVAFVLLFLNPILACVGFVMVPVSFWFTKFMDKKLRIVNEEYRKISGSSDSFIFSCFTNWKEIKGYNLEEMHTKIYKGYKEQLSRLFMKKQIYWYANRTFISFKDFFITRMNLYFIGGVLIMAGQMEVGVLLVFMEYYAHLFTNIMQITDSNLKLQDDIPSLNRVLEILDKTVVEKRKVKDLEGTISIQNVSFQYYEEQEPVLKNLNLDIMPQEHIAIVGHSGCGKTTLAKLLVGLYSPQEGSIYIGKDDINALSLESIGKKIGVVMQDPPMFNLTIRENLEFACRNVEDEVYMKACKEANIYDFIESLEKGLGTIIGERGIKLSGGQRQRLSIVRAILKNSDIIIFDESTSSLDSENEKAILTSIRELSKGKTIITIAHRLSTILSCDRVVVMDKGEIVAIGKHQDLRGKNEVYDVLFEKQHLCEKDCG